MSADDKLLGRHIFDSPIDLLVPERLDVAAKHVYARYHAEKRKSNWGKVVYINHILTINGGIERGEIERFSKIGMDDFINSYQGVLASIKSRGFDATETTLPVSNNGVLMNGAHRLAACIYYKKPVTAEICEAHEALNYNYNYFYQRGINQDVLDFTVLEYALLRSDCYVLLVWPVAEKHMPKVRQLVAQSAKLVCEKKIEITRKQMALNIVNQVYMDEPWINKGHRSGESKANYCFQSGNAAYIMCVQSNAAITELKDQVRISAGIGNHSAYSTDNKKETIRLLQLFFNRNSLHHLTYSQPFRSPGFYEKLAAYKQALPNVDDFCVHGSAVMEAYGIRWANDLDYINSAGIKLDSPGSSLSNEKPALSGLSIDQALEDPRHYFYYRGVKFSSLQAVMKMKQTRGERKDRRDVRMIKSQTHDRLSLGKAWRSIYRHGWLLYKRRHTRRKIKKRALLKRTSKGSTKIDATSQSKKN